MQIFETTQINDSEENIWKSLSSFEEVERYLPIVTKTVVEESGQGLKKLHER